MVERLGIRRWVRLYRGQLEPPEGAEPAFEYVLVELMTGELPDEPPAEEVVAFGSDVGLRVGTDELLVDPPAAVPVELPSLPVPVDVLTPSGVVSGVPVTVVTAPDSVGAELPSVVPLVGSVPSPSVLPPVVGVELSPAELSCLSTLPTATSCVDLLARAECEREWTAAVRTAVAVDW